MHTSQEHLLLNDCFPLHTVHTVQWLPPDASENSNGVPVEDVIMQNGLPQEQGKSLVLLRIIRPRILN